jgi:hypothetical protein
MTPTTRPQLRVKTTHAQLKRTIKALRDQFSVLSGDEIGNSGEGWQHLAAATAETAEHLAKLLNNAAAGNVESFFCFPSFDDLAE